MTYFLLKIAGTFGITGFFFLLLWSILNERDFQRMIESSKIPWINEEDNYDKTTSITQAISFGLCIIAGIFVVLQVIYAIWSR